MRRDRPWFLPLLAALCVALLLAACATPVGVRRAKPRAVQRYLTRNALTTDDASDFSQNELRRYDLLQLYETQPTVALLNLHGASRAEGFRPASLFALAELSFLHAERTKDPSSYAATVVYAWALLFPERPPAEPLDSLDPRRRTATDIYNRALALAFGRNEDGTIRMRRQGGSVDLPLPFGTIHLSARSDLLTIGDVEYYDLTPITELEISGIRNRYRRPGLGAPLAGRERPLPGRAFVVPLAPDGLVPLTAIAVITDPIAGLESGELSAHFELRSSFDFRGIEVEGRRYSLEAEPTAALAASLAESRFWKSEMRAFLGNVIGVHRESALFSVRLYAEGRIPVVFVHGTASSPGRWADMINDLVDDDRLAKRYSFWLFSYDSGSPIAYSAWQLRDALSKAVERADPSGTDPCVQDMVVLGHSQGGLLTKLTVIDSGDRFWHDLTDGDFESTTLPKSTKDLLAKTLFVKPLPFVTEVLFLATPHRGSYLAGPQIVRRLAERLVRIPSDIVRVGVDLVTILPRGAAGVTFNRIPTSIDNMSPSSPFIRTLSKIPVSPGVRSHSIIAMSGKDRSPESGGDGVVKYASAHVEGVDSELVVDSPHSGMQAAPRTIEEVRRILLEHSSDSRCPMPAS
jgi:triacylglycerol esterase/lipase EstA (alpha/beta hydrolase family)